MSRKAKYQQESFSFTPSSTNLFVRYLSREVDDDRLRAIFSAFGNITSSMVMRDIYSGQSLGTAFVRYEKHEEALRALRDAHGMPLLGKTVSVQWAKQQHDGTPAGQERLRMNKLFLRNVPLEVTEEDLVDLVNSYGSVRKVTIHNDTAPFIDATERRRIVFITFAEQGAAEAALRAVHNTCAFHQCRGIPLMCKLSEDYTNRVRTPQAVPVPHSWRYGGFQRSRSSPYSKTMTPRSENSMSVEVAPRAKREYTAGYVGGGTLGVIETPRSVDSASSSLTHQGFYTNNLMEGWNLSCTQRMGGPACDFVATPMSTWRDFAGLTTIHARDSGITVTVRHRSSARGSQGK
ncbi:RNA-binding protein, putative [Leishmania panamensis]|uniref:RNA-binding protein, putative n=1 Tax=Leishmania panamensis TaxID=5679 RepID=A0AC62A5H5_LEIPA